MGKCSFTFASQIMRIIYDKEWYERHRLKTILDQTGDVPAEILCPLCKLPDSFRHWTSECQHIALLTCRREILDSLPMPEGNRPVHIFTRAVLLLIPQLLRDTTEPERLWTSNLNSRLRQFMFSRLLGTLRKTGINAARTGLRSALATLAKRCHKMWVPRHAAKKVERSHMMSSVADSDGDSIVSILLWVDVDEIEVSQTCSVDDICTDSNSQGLIQHV